MSKCGVLGGTFDPFHQGHLATAEIARAALGLDEVLIVPSFVPPHRTAPPRASACHRFAMASLATSGVAFLHVSDLELQNLGPSYTSNTLARLHALGHRAIDLFFITGADAFAEIETWSDYPAILSQSQYVVISRPGFPVGDLAGRLPRLQAHLHEVAGSGVLDSGAMGLPSIWLVDAATPDVSSTAVRRALAENRLGADMLSPAVEDHIRRHGLYLPQATPEAAVEQRAAAKSSHE